MSLPPALGPWLAESLDLFKVGYFKTDGLVHSDSKTWRKRKVFGRNIPGTLRSGKAVLHIAHAKEAPMIGHRKYGVTAVVCMND